MGLQSNKTRQVQLTTIGKEADRPSSNIRDPFDNLYGAGPLGILRPPLDPLALIIMPEKSDILGQCIRAFVGNIHNLGWELKKALHRQNETTEPADAQNERRLLEALFGCINSNLETLTDISAQKRYDLECLGNGFFEIVRNNNGDICELYHIPAYMMRLTAADKEYTDFNAAIRGDDGKFILIPKKKRFRRFVQYANGWKIYFKEFGDPRNISSRDGSVNSGNDVPATEVIHFRIPCNYSPYGVPRWAGQMLGILGSRKAEEINYSYFDNKGIPPLVVMISGGSLAGESKTELENIIKNDIKGSGNFHKILILEATPFENAGEIPGEKFGQVKIDFKPLTQFIQKDGNFLDYQKQKARGTISGFLLPPIYVGWSDDYNRATSENATRVAEQQIFIPDRRTFCHIINSTIMAGLQINNWTLGLLGPKTTDDGEVVTAIGSVKEALTIGTINEAVANLMGVPIPAIPDELKNQLYGMLNSLGSNYDPATGIYTAPNMGVAAKVLKEAVEIRKKLVDLINGEEAA